MTIALGFRCSDGVVLCTDSYENDGDSKREVAKIWHYQAGENWGLSVASAGEADLADSFTDGLKDLLGSNEFNEAAILLKLRTAIRRVRITYPDSEMALLVGLWKSPFYSRLFRVMHASSHLGPVRTYQSIGIGSILANFLCSQIPPELISVDDAVRLGAFVIATVKQHVDGCGGPTQITSYKHGESHWRIWRHAAIWRMEVDSGPQYLQEALQKFWKQHNPPWHWDVVAKFGGTRTPGDELTFLTGVAVEKLQTVSGRNKNEGFLFGNRDRLRKRALLEQEREQAQKQSLPP